MSDTATDGPIGPGRLCEGFVESLVAEALDLRRAADPLGPMPVVDRERIWRSGYGATSLEQAIGRSVLAADLVSNELRYGYEDRKLYSPPPSPDLQARAFSPTVGERPVAPVDLSRLAMPVPLSESWFVEVAQTPRTVALGRATALTPYAGAAAIPDAPVKDPVTGDRVIPVPPRVAPMLAPPVRRGAKRRQRRRRLASFFGWVQFTGVSLILFVGWQLWGTSISQHHAQSALKQAFHEQVERATPASPSATPSLIPSTVKLSDPAEGSVVGHLQIPAIGVDEYVVEGTGEGDLAKGPGHYVGTAMPGQAGNISIAGHRTTYGAPFNRLDQLVPGDPITLTSDAGKQFRYVVSQSPVAVPPNDVSVLNYFGDNRLTLTTCNPKFSASQRLIAVAKLVTPVAAAEAVPAAHSHESAQPGVTASTAAAAVGWHLAYLPAVLLVLGSLVALGIANERSSPILGRRLRWLILAPIWVAAMYVLFGFLSSLLPATL